MKNILAKVFVRHCYVIGVSELQVINVLECRKTKRSNKIMLSQLRRTHSINPETETTEPILCISALEVF
jgi:hypothetical protein